MEDWDVEPAGSLDDSKDDDESPAPPCVLETGNRARSFAGGVTVTNGVRKPREEGAFFDEDHGWLSTWLCGWLWGRSSGNERLWDGD